jgi:hypothetical protein
LWKVLTPLFRSEKVKKLAANAGKNLLSSGINVGSDLLSGRDFGSSIKERALQAKDSILDEAINTLKGQGKRKRRTTTSRGRKSTKATKRKRTTSKKKKSTTTKRKPSKKAKKKKAPAKGKKQKRRKKDIFD